jgi:hypothetical protein
MLAAVTAAVRGEDPPAPVVTDPPADDSAATDPPAASATEDLIGTPPGEPAAAAPAQPQLDDQGRIRGPDGKFVAATPKPADPAAPAAAAAAPKAVDPAAPAVTPKAADPINDPIPATAKPETRERIQTLVDTVKATSTERDALRTDLELLTAPITEAGATLEQFQESMNLLKLINSPMQHEQAQALEYLEGAAAALAQRLGRVPAGTDPLTGQDDLIQRVNARTLSRQDAEEIAASRRAQAATQQFQRDQQQRSQQTQAQQQQVQAGQTAVRAVEETLQATDPQYAAKIAVLRADTAFVQQLRTLPPGQWAAAFAQKYREVKIAAPAPAPAPAPAAARSPSPLRAKNPAGNTAKPPGTMLEAVKGAIEQRRTG